ncbi:glycine zipper 2TM domain-containing protein [Solimonas terrae]|uniref:Glycine zipper 2TM domain-containing protein n=1 Tax=Solimonas terrae TaxID=1396819 RepID=A0A6M2BTE5_9GAMM|nr:glycine zipper 2TM domain-containing protein [Solimonas terrae]NGY05491.1 glycine zipper 2TM domain-containing protein [Solimonas terrae]
MQNGILRTAIVAMAFSMVLAACSKPAEPPPVTDPAQTQPAEQPAPAPAEQPAPAEPVPVPPPAPAPAPKPRPKPRPAPVEPTPPPPPQVCYDCGTISNIAEVREKGQASGAGAVAGGVAGGVIGHQFGKGKGRDAATVLGALAGAVGGHMAEQQIRATTAYDVTVSMETGSTRVINVPDLGGLTVGERVRIDGNTIVPR